MYNSSSVTGCFEALPALCAPMNKITEVMRLSCLIPLLLLTSQAYSQLSEPDFKTEGAKELEGYLKASKLIHIKTNPDIERGMSDEWMVNSFYQGVKRYFSENGFPYAVFTSEFEDLEPQDDCSVLEAEASYKPNAMGAYTDITVKFTSCQGEEYVYRSAKSADVATIPSIIEKRIAKKLKKRVGDLN